MIDHVVKNVHNATQSGFRKGSAETIAAKVRERLYQPWHAERATDTSKCRQ